MESFFERYRNPLLLVALVLIQVIMLASQIGRSERATHMDHPDGHSVRLIRLWVETAVSPFERLFGGSGSAHPADIRRQIPAQRGARQELPLGIVQPLDTE